MLKNTPTTSKHQKRFKAGIWNLFLACLKLKKQPQDNYPASCNSIDLKKTLLHLLLVQCSPFRKSRPCQESCLQTKSMSSIKQYENCITGKNVVVDDSHLKKPILGAQIPCDVRCTDLLLVDSTCSSKWEKTIWNDLLDSFISFLEIKISYLGDLCPT